MQIRITVINHISPNNFTSNNNANAGKGAVKLIASYIVEDVVNMFNPVRKANWQHEARAVILVAPFHPVIRHEEMDL